MLRFRPYLFIAIFVVLIFTGTACGATVHVQVFERVENITPVAGALVYANTTLAGKTNDAGTIEIFSSSTEVIPVRVEKFGYDSWNGEIDTNTTEILVELSKAKIAISVHLYDADTMDPVPDVSVTLEGDGSENTAISDQNGTAGFTVLARGSYRIGTDAEHYHPVSTVVDVGVAGKDVQVMLFRDDRFSIVVKDGDSDVPLSGARVFVEGIERGVTDPKGVLTLPMQRGKVYLIRVVMDGYQDYHGRQIVESDTAFLTIPLVKAPFTIFVFVYNEDEDPVEDALVLIDNTTAGITSRYGRAVLTNLTAGRYLLEVQHPGYVPARQSLTVAVQGEDIVTELLYQKENITIRTVEGSGSPVANVKVSLNGEEEGFTGDKGTLPVLLRVNLPYTITAEKEGYHQATIEKEISASNTTSSIEIPMKRNFNWMLVGVAGIGLAAVIGVVLVFRGRASGHSHRKREGL
jgi:hypothetical protein